MPKASMMMDALADMIGGNKASSNRCFYKSTTGCDKSREENIGALEYSYVRKAAYYAGCEYFDEAHLTDEFSTFHYKHPYPNIDMYSGTVCIMSVFKWCLLSCSFLASSS
jgi:hypothetical protein